MNAGDYDPANTRVLPISRLELFAKMREGPVMVVDAQAPGWYEREHLPGAVRSDVEDIDGLATRLGSDRSREIVVYCWSETCTASAYVSERLARRGYTNIRRYIEGKRDWLEAGLPIESGDEHATRKAEGSDDRATGLRNREDYDDS